VLNLTDCHSGKRCLKYSTNAYNTCQAHYCRHKSRNGNRAKRDAKRRERIKRGRTWAQRERYFQYSRSNAKFEISMLLIQTLIQHSWLTTTRRIDTLRLSSFSASGPCIKTAFLSRMQPLKAPHRNWYKYLFSSTRKRNVCGWVCVCIPNTKYMCAKSLKKLAGREILRYFFQTR